MDGGREDGRMRCQELHPHIRACLNPSERPRIKLLNSHIDKGVSSSDLCLVYAVEKSVNRIRISKRHQDAVLTYLLDTIKGS